MLLRTLVHKDRGQSCAVVPSKHHDKVSQGKYVMSLVT